MKKNQLEKSGNNLMLRTTLKATLCTFSNSVYEFGGSLLKTYLLETLFSKVRTLYITNLIPLMVFGGMHHYCC